MEAVHLPEWPWQAVRRAAAERGVRVWPVGGVVRDAVLGRPLHDWDFAVEHDALGLARAVADALGGAFYALDVERDTGRVVLPGPYHRVELDFARLRGSNLEADLRERDFTLNAMALEPDGQLIDPTGGLADLQAGLVRAISPQALEADPLRMLRAVRLVAELGLHLETQTAAWTAQRAVLLAHASAERVRDELVRLLAAPRPADHLQLLDELALLVQVIPELEPLKEQAQPPPHRFNVWQHTLMTVEAAGAILEVVQGGHPRTDRVDAPEKVWDDLRQSLGSLAGNLAEHLAEPLPGGRARRVLFLLATLCHDLGKPLTCTEDHEGRLHFYGHERVGAELTAERLRQLRFSRVEVEQTKTVVEAHLRPGHLAQSPGPVTPRAVYRFFRTTGRSGVEVSLLALADHLAAWGSHLEPARWARRLEVARTLLGYYFEHEARPPPSPPLITGDDLIAELGLEEGPQIGRVLDAVKEAQAAAEVSNRQEALALARRLLRLKH